MARDFTFGDVVDILIYEEKVTLLLVCQEPMLYRKTLVVWVAVVLADESIENAWPIGSIISLTDANLDAAVLHS